MLEIDKRSINYCPGRITIREDGDKGVMAAAMMQLGDYNKKLGPIIEQSNKLVIEAIEFAAEDWQEVYD